MAHLKLSFRSSTPNLTVEKMIAPKQAAIAIHGQSDQPASPMDLRRESVRTWCNSPGGSDLRNAAISPLPSDVALRSKAHPKEGTDDRLRCRDRHAMAGGK